LIVLELIWLGFVKMFIKSITSFLVLLKEFKILDIFRNNMNDKTLMNNRLKIKTISAKIENISTISIWMPLIFMV
tara:strand:+ start:32247 stop:32471 length:225 start_codon:yes stop_codon:yes gene_type:complete